MNRSRYLLSRFGWGLFSIAFVLVFNFFLFRVLPGDPAMAGVKDSRLSNETVQLISKRYGLDKPVINCFESLNPLRTCSCFINPLDTQFIIYLGNLLHGEMGVSYFDQRPVSEILGERIINSVMLIIPSQLMAIFVGSILGMISAWKSHSWFDAGALVYSLATWSMPSFWFGIILLMLGSKWGFPLGGLVTAGQTYAGFADKIADIMKHMFIPVVTFVTMVLGQYMLISRSTLINILSEDYILTAKAKGLSSIQILKFHAFKNAMLPLTTMVAINLGFSVAGAIQIETVFSYPGVGLAIVEAVNKLDFPLLQAAFLVISISVIVANLLADFTYSLIDPRVRIDK